MGLSWAGYCSVTLKVKIKRPKAFVHRVYTMCGAMGTTGASPLSRCYN